MPCLQSHIDTVIRKIEDTWMKADQPSISFLNQDEQVIRAIKNWCDYEDCEQDPHQCIVGPNYVTVVFTRPRESPRGPYALRRSNAMLIGERQEIERKYHGSDNIPEDGLSEDGSEEDMQETQESREERELRAIQANGDEFNRIFDAEVAVILEDVGNALNYGW
jgi:hypothetical protein